MGDRKEIYDAAIVGSGPAGLTTAIYLARAGYQIIVLEKHGIGGQVASTWEVANYPGVHSCSGFELAETMRSQAEAYGSNFMFAEVRSIEKDEENWKLTAGNNIVYARTVVLALGAMPRKAGFAGEEEFAGKGVSYCAACDGAFFRGKEIYVVGGGVAAIEESIFLTRFAKKVTMIVRRERFSCPPSVAAHLEENDKIEVQFRTKIKAVNGDDTVTSIRFCSSDTNEEWTREEEEGFGVFVLAGRTPDTAWLPADLLRDEEGYISVDEGMQTSLKGIFAVGDVCIKKLRQITTAVSDGAVAAAELEKQLLNFQR